jgi:chromosome segregation ATPase
MMVEAKRREVEEVRQYHMRELLDFRDKADKEVVGLERTMQTQLAEKDATIKDLEKALEKLSHNLKLDGRESDILVKLLGSFQEYNHLSQIIQERSEELSRFRQQVQELDLVRIKAESRLKEVTSNESNLHHQMERLAFEKRDLENKLAAQKLSLEKCEQDKDAMENYYDRKWNKEYANVKQQLERTFAERIASMEAQCTLRVEGLERAAR